MYGVSEGRVRSGNVMGWSLIENYIGGPDYFKISGPDRGPESQYFIFKIFLFWGQI